MTKQKKTTHTKRHFHKRRHWPLLIALALVFLLCGGVALQQAYRFYKFNIGSYDGEGHGYYVYPETTYSQLLQEVEKDYCIASPLSLRLHSLLMSFPAQEDGFVRTGYYKLPAKLPNRTFILKFRNGWQDPVRVSFNNIRLTSQLAARIAPQLMLDSAEIASRLADERFMAQYGVDLPNAMTIFLPDTYEMYWNITADELFERMYSEYRKFWNDERLAKAKALGFTPQQIAVIASIVEEETNKDSDKPIIAGLYMNRLRIGMPLQACPTVKYALQDFTLRRILNKHLEVNSPYNTYKHTGLPPGPIRVPRAQTLDYVLNPVKSNYLYMCASTAFDGTHHFSATYAEHAAYARLYQAALTRRGIR